MVIKEDSMCHLSAKIILCLLILGTSGCEHGPNPKLLAEIRQLESEFIATANSAPRRMRETGGDDPWEPKRLLDYGGTLDDILARRDQTLKKHNCWVRNGGWFVDTEYGGYIDPQTMYICTSWIF
jgi:hypothetical protein